MMQNRGLAWLMTAAALGAIAVVTLSGGRAEPSGSVQTGKPGIAQGTGKSGGK